MALLRPAGKLLRVASTYPTPHNAVSRCLITSLFESAAWIVLGKNSRSPQLIERCIFKSMPFVIQDRAFSKVVMPPHLQRQIGMKLYRESAGVLLEPYKQRARLPFMKRWFTKEGWKQTKELLLHELKTAYAVAKLRQKAGYTRGKFYAVASTLYKQINGGLAEGDRTILRQLVTENMFSTFKKELKQREGVWARVHWEIVGPIKIQTLQGRLASIDQKDLDNAYVQLTLMIKSNQIFGAYDKQGKLVAGDPNKEILVEDIWVFETILSHPDKKWRLCARISA